MRASIDKNAAVCYLYMRRMAVACANRCGIPSLFSGCRYRFSRYGHRLYNGSIYRREKVISMKKKKYAKLAASMLLLSMAVAPLAGCSGNVTHSGETGTSGVPDGIRLIENGVAVYTVVRGDNCSDEERDAAVKLKKRFQEITGVEIGITTDWEDKNEDNSDRYEILVGSTNRAESAKAAEGLDRLDFVICEDGKKIVICGGSPYSIAKAVNSFIAAYLEGKTAEQAVIPAGLHYVYKRAEHPKSDVLDNSKIYSPKMLSVLTNPSNQDKDYIYKNTAAAVSDIRFVDGTAELIYRFDISEMAKPTVTLSMRQAFVVEVAEIPGEYQLVAEESVGASLTNIEINPYDYGIYDTLYIRLTDPTPEDGGGAAISSIFISYYQEGDGTDNPYYLNAEMKQIVEQLSHGEEKSPVNGYKIHSDGGMIYNAVSRDQAATLDKYEGAETYQGTVKLNGAELTYEIPKKVTAYDCVPIKYTLTSEKAVTPSSPLHISATAQEDKDRENGKLYYDLNLPGTVDVTYTYDGYVTTDGTEAEKPVHSLDFKSDKIAQQYPSFGTNELRRSGTLEQATYTWFKFTYTNTGDTVLDGDGNGTFCFQPLLYKKNGSRWEKVAEVSNMVYRIVDEVYPGESGTLWVIFQYDNMPAGEYYIKLNGIVRNEISNPENFGRTIWLGEEATVSTFRFKVAAKAEQTEPEEVKKTTHRVKRNKWLHTYEEFQSSYESWLKMSAGATVSGTMYLQCAPWCNQVVLKLIEGDKDSMQAVSIPVEVESDSLQVEFNPDNKNYVVLSDGTRFPAIMTQSMADMRINISQSPDSKSDVVKYLAEMKDLGINVVNTTAGFAYDDNGNGGNAFSFATDVMRLLGLKMEGFVSYPYVNPSNIMTANKISGGSLPAGGNGSESLGKANAILAKYQFLRWGDNYWVADGHTILSVEHTRGGTGITERANTSADMRDSMDVESKGNFIIFCRSLYGTIDALNEAWGSSYQSFYDIDPFADSDNKTGVFRSWSRALADLDSYRTLERVYSYRTLLEAASDVIPNAMLDVRLEGSHWMGKVDPDTDNIHYRHVYYDQRSNAIIPELLASSGTVYCYSTYIWDAYRPSEVAHLTKTSLENGVVPANLPLFNRMRDVAINSKYGQDYTYQYNLSGKDSKGVMINTTVSLYEWWKATYENGGVPGILWSDWLCDGYATATQRREIQFFVGKLTEALQTDEGQKWATEFEYDDSVPKTSNGVFSYDKDFVQDAIDAYYASKSK